MKTINKVLDKYIFPIVGLLIIMGNNPIIMKNDDWLFVIMFLSSWIISFLLLAYYLLMELSIRNKIINVFSVFFLNILFIVVFFFSLCPNIHLSEKYPNLYRAYYLSGTVFLSDIIILSLILIIISTIYYLLNLLIKSKFPKINAKNLRKIFLTALTIDIFFMIWLTLIFAYAPEFNR
jgi:Kef-type K+ transport system membrane component KefB